MKVLHIATQITGGAGAAMIRLHQGLLAEGVNSRVLVQKFDRRCQGVVECEYNYGKPYAKRIFEKLKFSTPLRSRQNAILNRFSRNYEMFSFPNTDYNLINHPLVKSADILHLHWVSGFVDLSLIERTDKPIFWTCHDMNPFLGGLHYDIDEDRLDPGLLKEEFEIRKMKRNIFSRKNIKWIFPSNWMKSQAVKRGLDLNENFKVIPYGIDSDSFYPVEKEISRKALNLPVDATLLMVVAESLINYRKGMDLLMDIINDLPEGVKILAVGDDSPDHKKIIGVGRITDERLMSIIYSASDIILLPSRSDNLPNVVLEALACNRPVIAFKHGGMSEILEKENNGWIVENVNSEDLFQTIIKAIETLEPPQFLGRQYVMSELNLRNQAIKVKQFYHCPTVS